MIDFNTRVFHLRNQTVIDNLCKTIINLPVDYDWPLMVTIEKHRKTRTKEQNALMWGHRLKMIADQVWVLGKQFDSDVWHEQFKRKFLPEFGCQDYDKLVTKGYRKWVELPDRTRDCIGSTTQLTTLGMTKYLEECDAFAITELGVCYDAQP